MSVPLTFTHAFEQFISPAEQPVAQLLWLQT